MVNRTQVAADELGRQLSETRAALASSASQSLENVRKETLGLWEREGDGRGVLLIKIRCRGRSVLVIGIGRKT